MSGRYLFVLASLLLGCWVALEFMQWQLKLGKYARSPQHLVMSRGDSVLVAGGKASLFYEDRRARRTRLVVRCKEVNETLRLRSGEISQEICGVRVALMRLGVNGEVEVEVRWGEGAGAEKRDD